MGEARIEEGDTGGYVCETENGNVRAEGSDEWSTLGTPAAGLRRASSDERPAGPFSTARRSRRPHRRPDRLKRKEDCACNLIDATRAFIEERGARATRRLTPKGSAIVAGGKRSATPGIKPPPKTPPLPPGEGRGEGACVLPLCQRCASQSETHAWARGFPAATVRKCPPRPALAPISQI